MPTGSSSHLLDSIQTGLVKYCSTRRFLNSLTNQDTDAEARLIDHFSRPVRLKLRARLRSPELAEDAARNLFCVFSGIFAAARRSITHRACLGLCTRSVTMWRWSCCVPTPAVPSSIPLKSGSESGRGEPDGHCRAQATAWDGSRGVIERDQQVIRRVLLDEEDKDAVCSDLQDLGPT